MATLKVVPAKTEVVVTQEKEYVLRLNREEALHLASIGYSNFSANSVVERALRPLGVRFALNNHKVARPMYGAANKSTLTGLTLKQLLSYAGYKYPNEA